MNNRFVVLLLVQAIRILLHHHVQSQSDQLRGMGAELKDVRAHPKAGPALSCISGYGIPRVIRVIRVIEVDY